MDYAAFDLDSLSALVASRGNSGPEARAESEGGDLPPLPAQRRLWFMDRLLPGSCLFNLPFCVRIEGPLDPDRFRAAVKRVMHRQPSLRSVFIESGDDAMMRITDRAEPPLEMERRDEDRLSRDALADIAERCGRSAFDLETGPLFRLRLVLCGEDRAYLFATFHHICFDGWSIGVFFNDLCDAYGGRLDMAPPDDAIAGHLRQAHHRKPDSSGLAYWRARLAKVPPLRLPTDRERPAEQNHDAASVSLRLPPTLRSQIDELATAEGASHFMVLLAAWQLLLSRYAGQDRFAIGTPISGRDSRPELEALVGMFVNTLPVLADVGGNPSWRSLLARVRAGVLEAFGHKDTPFDSIVAALDAPRDPSIHPIHQAGFILQNQAGGQATLSEGLALFPESVAPVASQLDVELQVWPEGDGYRCDLIYCPRLFDSERMERLLSHYRNLLAAVTAQPDLPISEYAFLDADEVAAHRALLRPAADSEGLLARLETAMRDHGDEIAIEDSDGTWTYRELRSAAESVAAAIQSQGIEPGEPVALFVSPSRLQVAAILGVLLSGGAWVGLDSRYPQRFLARVLADCRARILLVTGTPPPFAKDAADVTEIDIGTLSVADQTSYPWAERDEVSDRAYIIYTSGSTGEPKGVIGTRRGILNRHDWMCRFLPPNPDDVFCYKTTLGFVDSVQEILSPLLAGGRLVIAAQEVAADASLLLAFLARHRVSRLTLVPSLLAALLDLADNWREQLSHLRLIISSGEVLPVDTARRLLAAAPTCRLLNIYGSSEVSADVTAHQVEPADLTAGPVPIGRPMDGCRLFVVDETLQPVPFGRPGELLVGGRCLAEGYWQQPELTESRFYSMPEADGTQSRVFATGDLVSLREDGCLLYHGRRDWQVKVRGQRVDLDGVQACLEDGVRRGVVLTITPSGSTDPILVALVEGTADGPAQRTRLGEELAAAMVPSFIWPIDAIPLLPNGKADRRAAADMALQLLEKVAEAEGGRALTATERRIAAVWAEFLPIGTIRHDSDFFTLGGHSLLAVRVARRLSQDFDTTVSLRTLMRATTLTELAQALDAQAAGDHGQDYPLFKIRHQSSSTAPVLSRTQQRLMFLESKSGGDSGLYHFPIQFVLPPGCSAIAAEAALRAVVARHDVFRLGRNEPPPMPFDVRTVDDRDFASLVQDHARRPFDLEVEGAIRALLLVPVEGGAPLLAVVMHHLITDAWSMGVFANDLRRALKASIAGDVPALPSHPVRWADYVASLEHWLDGDIGRRHLDHWTAALLDLPPPIRWPGAFVASPSDHRARDWSCEIGQDRVAALKRHTAAKATTAFAVVHAALNMALHRLTGAEAVLVGTATANRDHPECSDMLGVLANTLPVLTRPDRPDSAADWLSATAAALKDALAWPWLPLDRLADALGAGEAGRPSELFQVFCNQLPTAEASGDRDRDIEVRQSVRLGCEFDLMLFFQADDAGAWSLHWRCRDAVFPREFPESFTALYLDCLDLILEKKQAADVAPVADLRRQDDCGRVGSALSALPSVADVHVARRLDADSQIRLVAFVVPNGSPKLPQWRESVSRVDRGLAERVAFAPLERLPRDDRGNLALEALADCPAWDEQTLSAVAASCQRQVETAVGTPELLRPTPNARPLIHRWEVGLSAEAVDAAATASSAAPVSSSAPPSLLAGPPLAFPNGFPATLTGQFTRAAQGDGALIQIDESGTERRLSYAQLRQRALSVLAALQQNGLQPGERVFVLTGNPIDVFTALWACLYGGLIACPFPAPKSVASDDGDLRRMAEIGKRISVAAILIPEELERPDPAASDSLDFDKPWLAIPDLDTEQTEPATEHEAAPNDVALLLFTSGSTGLPKAVMLSHVNLLAMAEGLRQRYSFTQQDSILNWMPLEHIGVLGMLSSVAWVTGASQVHVDTAHVLADPLRWLDLLDRYRTAHAWAPHFAFALIGDLAEQARGRSWDLSCVKCLINGGEAVVAGGLARFLAVATPHGLSPAAIAPSWGMSETSSSFLMRQGVEPEALAAGPYAIVDVGTPHPGAEARLVDKDGRSVPLGEEGRLEVRGPQVNLGYWGDAEATAASRDDQGWFRTGDRARFEPDGAVITGRDKEVIIVNGQNYSQQALEGALEELKAVTTTCVAAVGVPDRHDGAERLAVFFHSPLQGQALARQGLAAMRDKLRRGFGLLPDYFIPLAEDEFPKTAIGKIQRKALRQRFIERHYDKRIVDIDKLEANNRTLSLRLDRVSWVPVPDRAEPASDRDDDEEKALFPRMPAVVFPGTPADVLALAKAGPKRALVITRAAFAVIDGDTPDPAQAACLALARNLAQERSDIALRLLDLGAEDDAAQAIRRETAALLQGETCRNRPFQAERAGHLHKQALFPHSQTAVDAPSPLRRNGRYLVSGGTGAVGQAVVGWLLRRWACQVTVVGQRSDPTEAAGWNDLEALAAATPGAALTYLPAGDPTLEEKVLQIAGASGPDGLFHLGGLYRHALLDHLDADDLAEQISVKAGLLSKLAACIAPGEDKPIVAFSSALPLLGAAGSAAYAAANLAMEAEVARLSRRGHRAMALLWPAWTSHGRGVGMSAGHDDAIAAQSQLGLPPLDGDRAIDMLEVALRLPAGVHAVGLSEEGQRLSAMMVMERPAPYRTVLPVPSPDVDRVLSLPTAIAGQLAAVRVRSAGNGRGSGLRAAKSARFERHVRDCWAETLGVEIPPSPDSSFFELGGDSIRLFRMHALLQERSGLSFPQVQLFRHTTIGELTEFLTDLEATEPQDNESPSAPQKTAAQSRAALRRSARRRANRESHP